MRKITHDEYHPWCLADKPSRITLEHPREEQTMEASFSICSTPDGPFSVIATTEAVIASGWVSRCDELVTLIHPSLRPSSISEQPHRFLTTTLDAVSAYYQGDLEAPSLIEVHQMGGPFFQQVWQVLRGVKVGEIISYSELAVRAGRPKAVRAAGSACATNAVALFVPCHRIVRADGRWGGFGYGLAVKQSLVDRESQGGGNPGFHVSIE
ncbi:MAG: methylated-DNA--[protein]-cysteine S-methyltransferase [Propionibacteriaceae bacterium]|nr:methylated-DNA--[protein]-cysteine S-methyltransferase [Propionibacteriaceae bacterium]